ncbi:MAG: MlaD family protein [Spirochaetales bacterium]|jgi:phospholipid/cholesterol/gamma-HCH transport system substrate-binding protein|nr:MlaD family protein [Spirochaetales bacterium]
MSRLFKIGLFVLITAAGTVVYMMRTADRIESKDTYMVEVFMDDASGLLPNTNVRMAGVSVGKVRSVDLIRGRAKLVLEIASDVQLYEDARITKKLDSMLGSSSVAIFPGLREDRPLAAGGLIQDSVSADAMSLVMEEAAGLVTDLRRFLNEDGGFLALHDILESTKNALADLSEITKQIRGTSEENLAPLAVILQNTAGITARLDLILANNNENINETLAGIRESVAKLNVALENIAGITGKINSGEGTIGKLVTDETLHNQISSVVGDLKSFMGSTAGLQLDVAFQSDYLTKQKEFRNQFGVRLTPENKDKFYLLGLVDTPRLYEDTVTTYTTITGDSPPSPPLGTSYTTTELEKRQKLLINAQIARRFGMFTLRGGVIESTGGAGIDFEPFDMIAVSAEIFDFGQEDGPYLRAFANFYPFFDPGLSNPLNWIYVGGGMDNILTKRRDFFVNMGLRFTDNDLKGIASIGGGLTSIAQ